MPRAVKTMRGQECLSLSSLMADTKNIQHPSIEREMELARIIVAAPKDEHGAPATDEAIAAANELVVSNLKFLFHVAKNFEERNRGKASLDDIVAAAYEGAVMAANRFQPRGNRFCSYAVWYAKAQMRLMMDKQSRPVAYPNHTFGNSVVAFGKLGGADLYDLTVEEIHTATGLPRTTAEAIKSYYGHHRRLHNHRAGAAGSREPSKSRDMIDRLVYRDQESPDQKAIDSDSRVMVQCLLKSVTDREAYILKRFYLDPDEPKLATIGKELGLCHERVRQLRNAALAKARERADRYLAGV